jgi:hypothetical protein
MNSGSKIIKRNIIDKKKINPIKDNKPRIFYSKDGTEKGVVLNGKIYLKKNRPNNTAVAAGKTITGRIILKKK